ncbi:MAG: D-glycero-alpha-D-manno-heptose-1,7-bisphosphate 7-phosphatase [Flavobacteriales bacterium]|nr:D-glycero-alpha-D-manno-heptose-1,7-bisphosphate 7-phosphatase [Flavobacteriales bacterium]
MRKIIFLDRDGVINIERGDYTFRLEDFVFVDGLFSALSLLKNKGFEFIVITNQGGISKGIYTHDAVNKLNKLIKKEFEKHQLNILDIYYCPHHSDIEKCICRKPNSLLIEKAIAKYNIDTTNSFFIGDSDRDIEAAHKVGVKGIKVNKNSNLNVYLNQIITKVE